MATYTSNYAWTKPSGSDNVDISVLNNNLDDQDSTIHDAFLNMAPPFSESSTYAVDDIVLYGTGLYKCHTAVVTPGSWTGSTNWQVYKLSEGGGGTYAELPDKPSINGNELSGNKTGAQLGLQNTLTFDNVPTANSTNPVKSGGVYSADEAIRQWTTAEAKSVSGNPITLTDGSARNAEGLVVTLEPVQSGSGTPSPENVRPITGLTECVVLDEGENFFANLTKDTSKGYIDNYYLTSNGSTAQSGGYYVSEYLEIKPNTSYYIDGIYGNAPALCYYDSTKTYISGVQYANQESITDTSPSNAKYMRLSVLKANESLYKVRYASAIATATITFGQTIYGGSVDFKTGVVTVTKAYKVFDGTENWYVQGNANRVYTDNLANSIVKPSASATVADITSNIFGAISSSASYTGTRGVSVGTSGYVEFADGVGGMTVNAWKTYLENNTVAVCYELATPTELTLTPAELNLLKGYNYITTNGTTIALDYLPDSLLAEAKNYVDAKIPPAPTTDGTYVLTCTVSSGTPAYTWESAT